MEVAVTTEAIGRAKLQSNHHHQRTNIQFFTGRMPFLLPNKQYQSTEGKNITSNELAYPKLGVFRLLSLTNYSSWWSITLWTTETNKKSNSLSKINCYYTKGTYVNATGSEFSSANKVKYTTMSNTGITAAMTTILHQCLQQIHVYKLQKLHK